MRQHRFAVRARRGNGILILIILIALAIGLYLMFGNMGGTSYMNEVKKAKVGGETLAREISTDQMNLLIAMYRESNKKLPKSPADLDAPGGSFNDPWGKEMTFTFEEKGGKTTVTYLSAGQDGQFKTEDDKKYVGVVPY